MLPLQQQLLLNQQQQQQQWSQLAWLQQWPEIATVRAAVVATNAPQAEPFWAAMGYEPTEVRPYAHGDLVTTVRIWTRHR